MRRRRRARRRSSRRDLIFHTVSAFALCLMLNSSARQKIVWFRHYNISVILFQWTTEDTVPGLGKLELPGGGAPRLRLFCCTLQPWCLSETLRNPSWTENHVMRPSGGQREVSTDFAKLILLSCSSRLRPGPSLSIFRLESTSS
jgi:hypothetical protein